MEEYFSATIKKLKSNDYNQINIVLGNESCDLDSAVSSIVYTIFLYWHYNQIKCTVCTHRNDNNDDKIFVPMLDVKREDYPLKTEVIFCLREHGINEDYLVFRDDINIEELATTKDVNIILVDHHIIAQRYEKYIPYVREIIDHRPKDEDNWLYKPDVRSTIETVGSCASLVTQRIRDLSRLLGKDEEFLRLYPECTDMLHGVILLDTVNFSKKLNKATPTDVNNVDAIERILEPEDIERERRSKVEGLVRARSDVSALSAAQLIKKDLKILQDILVPTFPILVEEFLQRPAAIQAVQAALSTYNCTMAVLLGIDLKSQLRRDGAILSPADPARGNQLLELFQNWCDPQLVLQRGARPDCLYFTIMNLSASRKQIIPILNEFLANK
ncbi:exopolyphosphatase PRUNE1 [Aricia agestis]|uniref:exopolyphosphatase PRUNE1 n=1 Tax=Aricia agestis TaxID=91739 RepID=UPI001C208424|nr:exopolyphosphatase PRUNE1 [Aricia agestis]